MITELVKELDKIFNNKVYPTNAPEGEKPPYLVYFCRENEGKTLEGYNGLYESNIVLNVMTRTFSEANSKGKNLNQMIKHLTNMKLGVFYIQEVSLGEMEIVYENELKIYRAIVPIKIYFEEE